MGVLESLEPKEVFYYFEELCKIPHGSGNMEQISDYMVQFAKEHGLVHYQDEQKNVVIIKEATKGYEDKAPIILQGHLDMVAVKNLESTFDFTKDPLELVVEGDYIFAKDTSLGGDDGIAVAYCLAILSSDSLPHPRLEVILTVDEEIGMDGAREIDLSMCKGKTLINIDSEEEGIFLTSCAGGIRLDGKLQVEKEERIGDLYHVEFTGLLGGHSGVEIHKKRGNAIWLMAEFLVQLSNVQDVFLETIKGGVADNAIAKECFATFQVVHGSDVSKVLEEFQETLVVRYGKGEPNIKCNCNMIKEQSKARVITSKDTRNLAQMIFTIPNGVIDMSRDIEGLVETSLNLGIITFKEEELSIRYAIRSSKEEKKQEVLNQVIDILQKFGGTYICNSDYPGWEYKVDSKLREDMIALFETMYGYTPKVEAIHAGLECGLLASKIEDLDCISLGPDIFDIHTTKEKLSVSSTKRVWEFLIRYLTK